MFLELLLVLLILALVAALVAPRLSRSPAAAAHAEAYHLVALLRQARHAAAVAGRPCTVTLEPADASCHLRAGWAGPDGQLAEPIREAWAQAVTLPLRVRDTPADPSAPAAPASLSICFTPAGVARDHLLELAAPTGAPLHVQVRKPSGLVWLGDPSSSSSDPAALARLQSYWQTHLEGAR